MDSKPTLEQLLQSKRDDLPSSEYFENLLTDFSRRQRQELLNRSSLSLARERIEAWFTACAADLQTFSHGLLTMRRLCTGGTFAALLALAALGLSHHNQPISPSFAAADSTSSSAAATFSSQGQLVIPDNSAFLSNEAIAATLAEPLTPVRHTGLIFDSNLGTPSSLASQYPAPARHYVVDHFPTSASGNVSF